MSNTWRQVSSRIAKTAVEDIEAIYLTHGALAVTASAAEKSEEIFDHLDHQFRLWRFVEVAALYPYEVDLASLLIDLTLAGVEAENLQVIEIADQDWVLNWQRALTPLAFGHGLYICPIDTPQPSDARIVVRLEPGMAFGTGTHPTTAMCLKWIAARAWDETKIALDYGCGSGILALAMAKAGAKTVYGCDIDHTALEVARENQRINLQDNIFWSLNCDLPQLSAEVLIANILLEPLIGEKAAMLQRMMPGAEIVMSGILVSQAERLINAFSPHFELAVIATDEQWALVAGTKTGE